MDTLVYQYVGDVFTRLINPDFIGGVIRNFSFAMMHPGMPAFHCRQVVDNASFLVGVNPELFDFSMLCGG